MPKSIIFLDDDPARQKKCRKAIPSAEIVATAHECIKQIKKMIKNEGKIDLLFLDHDLGGQVFVSSSREDCGFEVVRWICENKPEIKAIVLHSMNVPAAENMEKALRREGYITERTPFCMIDFKHLSDFVAI